MMLLVVMRLVPISDDRRVLTCRLGVLTSFAVGLCVLFCDTFGFQELSVIHVLPFDIVGFG